MAALTKATRIVIKIGSSLLVDEDSGHLNTNWLASLAEDVNTLTKQGKQILIVSSGAIALGRTRLSLTGSLSLAQKQACAAAGQALLTQAYEAALKPHNLITAQALLTLKDTEDRRRWLNGRETLATLLQLGVVPIVNENDTVATDEIRYGDNDRLAARVAQMIGADLLILLSDIDGLYTADPAQDSNARHLASVDALTPEILAMAGGANQQRGTGTGGMATKLQAAKITMDAGCRLLICKGAQNNPIAKIDAPGARFTVFEPNTNPANARKQWISGSLNMGGAIEIDAGAVTALQSGKSLLAAGITAIHGHFDKGDTVAIKGPTGTVCAHGLAGYSGLEARQIIGLKTKDIKSALGYDGGVVIHRDNMVLIK